MANFTTLYSGSSGNCSVVEEKGGYLLVDMGKSCRLTTKALYQLGLSLRDLQGICVTHEHSDHVKGLAVFLKNTKVPVYGGAATLDYLAQHDLVPPGTDLVAIDGRPEDVGGFEVTAFPTSHDSVGCCGFRITAPGGAKVALATDLGYVGGEVYAALSGCDLVALEANYDQAMLMSGPYPYYLKTRIASPRGHLDNRESAGTLLRLLKDGCEKFALCHMSQENNTPLLVMAEMHAALDSALAKAGRDCVLQLSPRHDISPTIEV